MAHPVGVYNHFPRKKTLELITEFIARYRKEYDFHEKRCRMVADSLKANLHSAAGVRAIATSRAENPGG